MKKIVMLSVPPAHGVDVMGPLEVFGFASRMLEEESGRPGCLARMTSNPRFSPHRQTTRPPARRAALSAEGLTAGIVRGKWLLGQ